jgi:hypothetical protein
MKSVGLSGSRGPHHDQGRRSRRHGGCDQSFPADPAHCRRKRGDHSRTPDPGYYEVHRSIFRWLALALLSYIGSAILAKPEFLSNARRRSNV